MGNLQKIFIALLIVALAGCSTFRFPGVHRITVQQGNVISQSMIDKLKPGMTKSQVRFILGNPVIDDPLKSEQWDYIYTIQVAGGATIRRPLIIHFLEDRLSHMEGDYLPAEAAEAAKAAAGAD